MWSSATTSRANGAEISLFLQALNGHARRRVVLELPMHHPMSNMNPLWQTFWGLTRPPVPPPTS